jgi:hypothetical protein
MALIGTADGLYRDGERIALAGEDVADIAPARDGGWWAIVGGALWRGDGAYWETVASTEGLIGRCCLERDGTVLVGTSGAHLARPVDGSLEPIPAFAEAPGREEWFTPWGGPPDTRSLATDAASIYANVHVGGVLRAAVAGGPWAPTLDIEADVHEVTSAEGIVMVAAARGLGASRDDGGSWSFTTAGLHSSYCRAVTVADGHVLVSASDGPHGARGALYRRALDDDEAALVRCDGFGWVDGNIDSGWLAAEGATVACATPDGRLLVSEDAGATWSLRAEGLPTIRCVAVG